MKGCKDHSYVAKYHFTVMDVFISGIFYWCPVHSLGLQKLSQLLTCVLCVAVSWCAGFYSTEQYKRLIVISRKLFISIFIFWKIPPERMSRI